LFGQQVLRKPAAPFLCQKKELIIISSFALKIITFVYAILKISAPDYLLERGNLQHDLEIRE